MVKALVVGSFDPFTLGHAHIVSSALRIADEVDIVVGDNFTKKYFLPLETRIKCIEALYDDSKVKVTSHSGLISLYCEANNIDIIIKGIRNGYDFEYEQNMAIMNEKMCGVETVFVPTKPHLQHISSTLVKELLMFGQDVTEMIPEQVLKIVLEKSKKDEGNYE